MGEKFVVELSRHCESLQYEGKKPEETPEGKLFYDKVFYYYQTFSFVINNRMPEFTDERAETFLKVLLFDYQQTKKSDKDDMTKRAELKALASLLFFMTKFFNLSVKDFSSLNVDLAI
jgi:hypothetical protein